MKPIFYLICIVLLFSCRNNTEMSFSEKGMSGVRAPAYPLVTIDPYTCVWSQKDLLTDDQTRHWTGKKHPLIGAIRVDGFVYRFLGKEDIPMLPIVSAGENAWNAKYTFSEPQKGWEQSEFIDEGWSNGTGAFGSEGNTNVRTPWVNSDIWVRREFDVPQELKKGEIYLDYSFDDLFQLYLNGEQLVSTREDWKNNVLLELDKSQLKKGKKNLIAAHCHNTWGGSYVDFGIYQTNTEKEIFGKKAEQKSVRMSATRTQYKFSCGSVDLTICFVSPLLLDSLDLLSRPVNYLTYEVASTDNKSHDVQLYFETTPEWAVDKLDEEVEVSMGTSDDIDFIRTGTTAQPVLEKSGDDVRINWGYFYMAAPKSNNTVLSSGDYFEMKQAFADKGTLPQGEKKIVTSLSKKKPAMACVQDIGKVRSHSKSGFVMLAYDDIESIQYFGENLKAWWKHGGKITMNDVLHNASKDYKDVIEKCAGFDESVWEEAVLKGGENYADLCVLAYRQAVAAHKVVEGPQGEVLFFSKENFSNGSIATVDVTYPTSPIFLKYNTELIKGMLTPIFYYSESGKWTKPFAAHDVGTYPKANGQTYGGDMPVEESGNMILLTAAIAKLEGNTVYAEQHWKTLTIWADYLLEKGMDPENQLCTDDFCGHFAHNTNLSIKAILAIAAYGQLAEKSGMQEIADKYTAAAQQMAKQWMEMANDGGHYRLTFDKPDTWSQKYNLVWNKLLDLHIFPDEVAQKEVAFYLSKFNKYGLPLDSRATFSKSDWILWIAVLAESKSDFEKIIKGVHDFVNDAPERVPMTDFFETTNAMKAGGCHARPVVGGYFLKMLDEQR